MKYTKYLATAIAVLAAAGCTGDFEELNTNPNKVTLGGISPANVIEPLLINGANDLIYDTWFYNNEIGHVTVASASNVREEHCYYLTNANFAHPWEDNFLHAANAKHMYDLAVAQNDPNYQAIALTIKVVFMQQLTDLYGGIPYDEALRGLDKVLQPKVQTQQEVYASMMADLELANSLYNEQVALAKAERDPLYKGNIAKWRKFTNSLHLRLLMRVSGRNNDFTPSVSERIGRMIGDPATYPVFESNDDCAAVQYPGVDTYYRNYFNNTRMATENSFSGDHHFSEQMVKMTIDEATGVPFDPRVRIWAKPRPAAGYQWVGAVSGCSSDYGNNNKEREAYLHYETLVGETRPNYLMDYAEVLFIKAEAAFKGWIPGSAEQYYNDALTASCQKWNTYGQYAAFPAADGTTSTVQISASDIAAFLADPRVAYDGTLQRIAEEKWLSLFWICGYEMYNEVRRTGYPELTIGKRAIERNSTDGKYMARMAYPIIALTNNHANYLAAIQAMGGKTTDDNTMVLPVWWSGQAVARDAGTPWPHSFRNLIKGDK